MASPFRKIVFVYFLFQYFYIAICSKFDVNGDDGWFPPKHDNHIYNKWASNNRFMVYDIIHFKYKKDSVLVVTEEEYEKCETLHPQFFSNNGDTSFVLDRPGLFYFISGVTGHCQKGQKMIIKVLDTAAAPTQFQNGTTGVLKNDAVEDVVAMTCTATLLTPFIYISFLG